MKIGIIAAMEEEAVLLRSKMSAVQTLELYGFQFYKGQIGTKEVILLRSGIGKTASAMSTTLLIDHFKPDYVLNIGSAGALYPALEIGDVVISDGVQYHDVDVTGFGYEIGQMAQQPARFMAHKTLIQQAQQAAQTLNQAYLIGNIVSGDVFVNGQEKIKQIQSAFPKAIAAEMESASIAQVCHQMQVPFVIVRAISDRSDGKSTIDFEQFLPIAAAKSTAIVLAMIEDLKTVSAQ